MVLPHISLQRLVLVIDFNELGSTPCICALIILSCGLRAESARHVSVAQLNIMTLLVHYLGITFQFTQLQLVE